MIRKTYALLICIIFLFSCSLNNELGNAKNKYSVIFNLTANDSIQRIYFYRTAEVNEDTKTYSDSINYFTESYDQFFIKDANVQLESNKLTYTSFDVVKDYYSTPDKGFKYINLDVLTILPDTKYSLFIEYKDENIFGTTTTPGNFEILSPSNNKMVLPLLLWVKV